MHRKMTRIETYLRYQDVFGTPSTLDTYVNLARDGNSYNFHHLIVDHAQN